jgi:hypothetical protein
VLWLGNLTPGGLAQLDQALLDDLPAGMWILATVHGKHLKGYRVPTALTAAAGCPSMPPI